MQRNLSGIFFMAERDGERTPVCFEDLTEEEMKEKMNGQEDVWLQNLAIQLAKTLKTIGDQFDIEVY